MHRDRVPLRRRKLGAGARVVALGTVDRPQLGAGDEHLALLPTLRLRRDRDAGTRDGKNRGNRDDKDLPGAHRIRASKSNRELCHQRAIVSGRVDGTYLGGAGLIEGD